jgi:putative spermidine/putrescine transport system permease protein
MKKRLIFNLPLALLIIFAIVPLLLGIGYALLYSFGSVGVLNHGFTTQNWKDAFANNEVLFSFLYTIALSLVSLFLCVSIGMFIALLLGKRLHRGIASYIIYLPMAFPSIVAAFFFFQFLSNAGLLSRLFYKLGIIESVTGFPNLVNDKFGIGIITAQFFLTLPVFVLLYLSIISNENIERLKILASSLGAGRAKVLWRITIPALLKKSYPAIILFFIFKLGSYEIPLLLGRSSPETISVLIVRKMQRFNLMDIPQGFVVAVIYALLVIALLVITLKPSKLSMNV